MVSYRLQSGEDAANVFSVRVFSINLGSVANATTPESNRLF
jgi:hypothetical protein